MTNQYVSKCGGLGASYLLLFTSVYMCTQNERYMLCRLQCLFPLTPAVIPESAITETSSSIWTTWIKARMYSSFSVRGRVHACCVWVTGGGDRLKVSERPGADEPVAFQARVWHDTMQ